MSSFAQFAANRANSKLSTGPRTPEGKSVSSMNNFKLGLACRTFSVLQSEDQALFDQYATDLTAQYGVKTTMELTLVRKIAQHHWLSQRAFVAEHSCWGEDAMVENAVPLALIMRYQAHHDRAFHKTRNELDKLIAARRKREQAFALKKTASPQPAATASGPQPGAPKPLAPSPEPALRTEPANTPAVPINEAA